MFVLWWFGLFNKVIIFNELIFLDCNNLVIDLSVVLVFKIFLIINMFLFLIEEFKFLMIWILLVDLVFLW